MAPLDDRTLLRDLSLPAHPLGVYDRPHADRRADLPGYATFQSLNAGLPAASRVDRRSPVLPSHLRFAEAAIGTVDPAVLFPFMTPHVSTCFHS